MQDLLTLDMQDLLALDMQDFLTLNMQDLLQKQNDCSSGGMMKAIFQGKETPTLDNQQLPPALSGTFVRNCFIGF